jgi:hypothetical protein
MRFGLALIVLALVLAVPILRPAESAFCAGAVQAQQRSQGQRQPPPMPPPGNPGHVTPHKDAFCDQSIRSAHACKCHAKCVEDNDAPGKIRIEEDPKCRAWCFKDHCRCPVDCE